MWAICNFLFGCHHRVLSWPMTVHKPGKRTYVVCLTCGAEFDYDFKTMQRCQDRKQMPATPETNYAIQ